MGNLLKLMLGLGVTMLISLPLAAEAQRSETEIRRSIPFTDHTRLYGETQGARPGYVTDFQGVDPKRNCTMAEQICRDQFGRKGCTRALNNVYGASSVPDERLTERQCRDVCRTAGDQFIERIPINERQLKVDYRHYEWFCVYKGSVVDRYRWR